MLEAVHFSKSLARKRIKKMKPFVGNYLCRGAQTPLYYENPSTVLHNKFFINVGFLILAGTPAYSQNNFIYTPIKSADAVAFYMFNSNPSNVTVGTALIVHDLSSGTAPLDLQLYDSSSTNYSLTSDYLEFVQTNVLRSIKPATKIIEKCKNSNEISIELWYQSRTPSNEIVNNESDDQPAIKQSLRVISLGDTYFKEFTNFGFYQAYNDGEISKTSFRTSGNSAKNATHSNVDGLLRDPFLSAREDVIEFAKAIPQHIIITKSKAGIVNFYRSDEAGYMTFSSKVDRNFTGTIMDGWYNNGENVSYDSADDKVGSAVTRNLDMRLAFGNEASAPNDFAKAPAPDSPTNHSRNYPWVGKIFSAAIYCRALTGDEILGARAPHVDGFEKFPVDLTINITPSLKKAQKMYEMLNGVSTPIFNPRLKEMAKLIDENRLFDAAGYAIENGNGRDFSNPNDTTYYNPSFYNITVRDFAAPMSTRDESVNTELNDFIATVIGTVRDNVSAKELVSGTDFYRADSVKAAVPADLVRDILRSNLHYSSLAKGGFDLARVLVKSRQKLFDGTLVVDNPDPAGLITSRSFMESHAVAGTNRRMVEYSFREFMCIPIEKWAFAQSSDSWIGRDIDRAPGGSHTKYTQSCRACHSRMDPLRGAFAYYTFSNSFIKNTFIVPHLTNFNSNEDMSTAAVIGLRAGDPGTANLPAGNSINYVVKKMNHNDHVYPGGYVVTDNSFNNAALDTEAIKYFGWRSSMSGKGAHDFGLMIAQSEGFSRCMTKRVFKTLCKRDPVDVEAAIIKSTATEFENQGYKLKYLFKKIAGFPQCLGQ
jgi:hypothetical protein